MSIDALAEAIDSKKVQTLFILGGNPVYNALANLKWADKQKERALPVVRLGYHEDETSESATWHVPMAHFLEAWGDTRTADGTYCAIQPMILPLFGGYSDIEMHPTCCSATRKHDKPDLGPRDVRHGARQQRGQPPTSPGTLSCATASLPDTAAKEVETANFNVGAAAAYIKQPHTDNPFPAALGADDFEVVLINDYKVDDGRYANNGWLQEMPPSHHEAGVGYTPVLDEPQDSQEAGREFGRVRSVPRRRVRRWRLRPV